MLSDRKQKKKSRMDGLTAIAFAREAFEKHHPRDAWPSWLWKYTTSCYGKTDQNDYIVDFVCKPRTREPEAFFTAIVDCWTAETTVIKDTPLDQYNIDDLEPYP